MIQPIQLGTAFLALLTLACDCKDAPAQAKPDRTFTEVDRTRFIYLAILEGL